MSFLGIDQKSLALWTIALNTSNLGNKPQDPGPSRPWWHGLGWWIVLAGVLFAIYMCWPAQPLTGADAMNAAADARIRAAQGDNYRPPKSTMEQANEVQIYSGPSLTEEQQQKLH